MSGYIVFWVVVPEKWWGFKMIMKKCGLAFLLVLVALLPGRAFSVGEKYSQQGHRLFSGIQLNLIVKGFCNNRNDCAKKLTVYGEHGDKVNLNIYNAKKTEMALIDEVISFVYRRGLAVTGGVQIELKIYGEPHDYYGGVAGVFGNRGYDVLLEVRQ